MPFLNATLQLTSFGCPKGELGRVKVSVGENMWVGGCVRSFNPNPVAVAVKDSRVHRLLPRSEIAAIPKSKSNNAVITLSAPQIQLPSLSSSVSAPPPPSINVAKNPPELGLLSLLFVLSTAIGAIFSLAIISIPTMIAFKKLGVAVDKLSKIVSEEVPGTLSSLKLSGLEINELTQQLTSLRQKISGAPSAKKSRRNKSTSTAGRDYPVVD